MLRIRFGNGLILGGSDYQLKSPITGLDTPAVRNGNAVYAGADGGYMISQYYGHRTIVLKGFFIGNCQDKTDELRKELISKCYFRYNMSVVIEDLQDNYWFTQGYITDLKCDLTSPKVGEYQMTVLCPDPLIYPCANFTSEFPTVIEKTLTVNGDTTVLRQGDCDAYPVITLTGEFTNPIITIGNYAFGLGLTTDNTSIIRIDMKNRTVKASDGTSLAEYRLIDSRWLYLGQGANTINVETENDNDTGTAKLTYSAGYRGI